jgi:hypothetical protein
MPEPPLAFAPPAPNAPSGHLLCDLQDLADEIGGSYPMLAYALVPQEPLEEASALDPVILAALVSP